MLINSSSLIPTQSMKVKRNSLNPIFPDLCQSSSSVMEYSKPVWLAFARKWKMWLSRVQQGRGGVLNLILVMRLGDLSKGWPSLSARTTSFLFTLPSLLLSRNKNASTTASKVVLIASADSIVDVVWNKFHVLAGKDIGLAFGMDSREEIQEMVLLEGKWGTVGLWTRWIGSLCLHQHRRICRAPWSPCLRDGAGASLDISWALQDLWFHWNPHLVLPEKITN